MTIHEALPSSGRSRLLVAAALLAILALAGGALLWRPLTAFAHHTEYSATGTCAGWSAHAGYVGGSGKRLVVIEQVVVDGQQYDPSWSTGFATGSGTSGGIQPYTGGSIDGKGFDPGEEPATTNTYYWFGVDNTDDPNRPSGTSYDWTIFNKSGSWPGGSFSGKIYLYRLEGSGQNQKWDRIQTDEVTPPAQPTNCKFKVCKLVEDNKDGDPDGGAFSFTITIGNQTQEFQLTDNEGRGSACKEFSASPGATATVTEEPARPGGWLGDENGYPKYELVGQSAVSGSTATLAFTGPTGPTAEVTFRNKEVKSRQLEVCKKVEDDGNAPNKEKWTFTFTLSWSGGSATVTVQDVEEGKSAECVKVEVPDDAAVTVTESGRPSGWAGDAAGFPKWEVKSGSSGTGDAATVPANKDKVTFTNKEVPFGTLQVHKYLPKENLSPNAPWQNQGNSPSSQWTFTVYGSLSDAQNGTNPIASFSQLGQNSPPVPQTDLWIKETGLPSDQQFFGWYVPDGDGNSGNDKCNQQPLDGSTLDQSGILHIQASYWSTKGNSTGILHICAYNKPATRTVTVCKVVEENGDGVEQSGTFSVSWQSANPPHAGGVDLAPAEGGEADCKSRTVRAGYTYTVSEELPAGWVSASGYPKVQVDGGTPVEGASVQIGPVQEGEEIVVTFYNKHGAGELVICKDWKPNIDNVTEPAFAWQFDYDGQAGADVSVSVGEGESGCAEPVTVPAGTHTVAELGDRPADWPGDHEDGYPRYSLDGGSTYTVGSSAAVDVTDGGTTTVWFRNRARNRQATLTVCKVVQENGDGVEQSGTFSVRWESANPPHAGGVDLAPAEGGGADCKSRTVRAGYTYTVSEELPAGWVSASGYPKVQVDGGTPVEGASVQIGPVQVGEEIVVTFYNKHEPAAGTIVVKKVVTNVEGDTTEFDVSVTPQGGGSEQTGTIQETDADGTPFTVDAGTYTVSETPAAGYNLLGWAPADDDGTCPERPSQEAPAQVTVEPGGTVTVCFYNEKHGTATVEKTNDTNGEASLGGSFTWTITVTVSGGPLGTDAVVSDTLPDGWSYAFGTVASQFDCSASDLPNRSLSCTLPAGTAEGQYSIEVEVSIPSGESQAVCGPHTNTVVLSAVGGPQLDSDEDTVSVPCVLGSGTIIVEKVVVDAPGDTTSFTATVAGVGTGSFGQGSPATFPGLAAGTYSVTESPASGYTLLGHAVLEGEGSCPDSPASSAESASVSVTAAQPVWTVCFYNRTEPPTQTPTETPTEPPTVVAPTGSVWVRKVVLGENGLPDPSDQHIFYADVDGFLTNGAFNQSSPAAVVGLVVGTTATVSEDDAVGYAELGYVLVQGANAVCPVDGVSPTPGAATVTIADGALDWTVCFYNQAEQPDTPTPPASPTATETPTPEEPAEPPTPTPVETVAGEQTPGPGAAPTPLPPSAGAGVRGGGSALASTLLLLGLAAVSAGAGFLVLGRRRS